MLKYALSPRGVCTVERKICVHCGSPASPSAKWRAKNITTILLTVGFSFSKLWFGLVLLVCWFFFFLIRFFPSIWEYGLKMKGELERKFWLKKQRGKKKKKTLIARSYPKVHKASAENGIINQSVCPKDSGIDCCCCFLFLIFVIAVWYRLLF